MVKQQRWDGYVYIISLGFDGLFKIGKTRNFNNRIKALKSGNPKIKKVLCIWVKDRHTCEKELHFRLRNKLIEREIFKLNKREITSANEYLISNTPDGTKNRPTSKAYRKWINKKNRPRPPKVLQVSTHLRRSKRPWQK